MRRLQQSVQYCFEQVKTRDREQLTFAGSVLPRESRVGYIVLRAYNLELAQVRDAVTQSQYANIRMQWWKSVIKQTLDQSLPLPDHPIAPAIRSVVQKHRLTQLWLYRILSARERDIVQQDTLQNIDALEMYSEQTASALLYLSLQLVGVNDVQADHCASHIGKASGLVTALRAIPHLASSKGQVNLPKDLIEKHDVDLESVLKGQPSDNLNAAVFDVACQAKAHTEHAKKIQGVPDDAIPVLLQSRICELWLDKLEKCQFNIFDPRMIQPSNVAYLHLLLKWAKFRKAL